MKKAVLPVRVIMFDFGNVLAVDTEKVFEKVFHLERLPKWKRNRYEASSHVTERGEQPTRNLLRTMKEMFSLPMTLKQIEMFMISSDSIGPMWQLFKSLGADYGLAILSNNQKHWPQKVAKRLHISFRGIRFFNSAYIGTRKPQSGAYKYAIKELGVAPEQIVFVDDKATNLGPAKKLGMRTIHFTGSVPAVIASLKKYGVKVRMK